MSNSAEEIIENVRRLADELADALLLANDYPAMFGAFEAIGVEQSFEVSDALMRVIQNIQGELVDCANEPAHVGRLQCRHLVENPTGTGRHQVCRARKGHTGDHSLIWDYRTLPEAVDEIHAAQAQRRWMEEEIANDADD